MCPGVSHVCRPGPGGDYLRRFSPDYFTKGYTNEWGEAINFDGENAGPVREYFLANARYWIEEFHFDGLRVDATQQIFDSSPEHMLESIADTVKAAAGTRKAWVVGESEPQNADLVRTRGYHALWNDDFHHAAMVALTGRREAYYTDYTGAPQEFVACAKWGYLYHGQYYTWQSKGRGSPAFDLDPSSFMNYLQNHDQVANSFRGRRVHELSEPALLRAITSVLILGPQVPLLFQGQEFSASTPFYYFADHAPEWQERTSASRAKFLSQFESIASVNGPLVPPPHDPAAFEDCKLRFRERQAHASLYALYRDLLKLRREEPVMLARNRLLIDGAVVRSGCFVIRYFGVEPGSDRLLLVNTGSDVVLSPNPEPLLAPRSGAGWRTVWYSEDPKYGGGGAPPLNTSTVWHVYAHTAYFLAPAAARETVS